MPTLQLQLPVERKRKASLSAPAVGRYGRRAVGSLQSQRAEAREGLGEARGSPAPWLTCVHIRVLAQRVGGAGFREQPPDPPKPRVVQG